MLARKRLHFCRQRKHADMFKAVIFDLYETLVTQMGTDVPRAGALGESLGLNAIAYRREWKRLRPLVLRGELTFEQALVEAGARLRVAIPADRARQASDDRARANAQVFQKIDPDIVALTRELQRRNVRLATISNCMAEDAAPWPACNLAPQFTCAVFSYGAGCVKPDPQIYRAAIDRLDVSPADTLYIGDGGDDELAGAQREGLRVAQAGWYVSRVLPGAAPFLAAHADVMNMVCQ
jgi:putative hydrolase of the HAD superfamily